MQCPPHNLRIQLLSCMSDPRRHTAQLWMIRQGNLSLVQTAIAKLRALQQCRPPRQRPMGDPAAAAATGHLQTVGGAAAGFKQVMAALCLDGTVHANSQRPAAIGRLPQETGYQLAWVRNRYFVLLCSYCWLRGQQYAVCTGVQCMLPFAHGLVVGLRVGRFLIQGSWASASMLRSSRSGRSSAFSARQPGGSMLTDDSDVPTEVFYGLACASSGRRPSPRWGHASATFQDRLFIFGGVGTTCHSDSYVFNAGGTSSLAVS